VYWRYTTPHQTARGGNKNKQPEPQVSSNGQGRLPTWRKLHSKMVALSTKNFFQSTLGVSSNTA
jgi:hypothetical protein